MFVKQLLAIWVFLSGLLQPPGAQIALTSPRPGDILQGAVPIVGTIQGEGLKSAELSFQYAGDDGDVWFAFSNRTEPANEITLAIWDTTTITDGDYRLRLQVSWQNGSQDEIIVDRLRVRNYLQIETATVTTSVVGSAGPVTPLTASRTPQSTATRVESTPSPVPPNPLEIGWADIGRNMGRAALAVIAAFGLYGIYLLINRKMD